MAAATIYAGPGEMVFSGALLMAVQENGLINYQVTQQKLDLAQAMHGRVGSQLGNTTGRITVTPFDNWSALPVLFPTFLGVTTGSGPGNGAGALKIGTRPHNPPFGAGADLPATIWNPDGLQIVAARCAVSRHPDLHLGVGKPLFGQMELLVIPSTASGGGVGSIGTAGAFHTITENGAAQPANQFVVTDFVREAWTGVWGAAAGFGAIQAEEEWTISANVRYDELKVQEQTIALKLASVEFMARCRPYGPTWSNIEAQVLTGRLLGSRWGNPGAQAADTDLVLTSNLSGKTITLENVDVQGEGFEFGGARLATGEVGFVTQTTFNAGAPEASLIFSA